MSAILAVDGASKRYLVRPERSLVLGLTRRHPPRPVWALRDVSISVEPGEVLAAIGRNGAGKSTLLKLCSGVTAATEGTIRRPRRVAPLIEVAAGFHPDLTGRENVEVNGRLLGIRPERLRAIFDDIVEFAELNAVIDQQVKQYSTGMLMRLGFAVAAHTEPELLIVDEVLAVGDLPFQHRCLERIKQMREGGAGVLFVSHDLGAVLSLSDRALLLHRGEMQAEGDPQSVVAAYHELLGREGLDVEQSAHDDDDIPLDDALSATHSSFTAPDGTVPSLWETGQRAEIAVRFRAVRDQSPGIIGLQIFNAGGGMISGWMGDEQSIPALRAGEEIDVRMAFTIPVNGGRYVIDVAVAAQDWTTLRWASRGFASFSVAEDKRRAGPVGLSIALDVEPT